MIRMVIAGLCMVIAPNILAAAPEVSQVAVKAPDGKKEANGVEFTTESVGGIVGSIRIENALYKPNAANTGFDDASYFSALAIQPDAFFLLRSKNAHTEIDYLEGVDGGRPAFSACLLLEHGWVYVSRRSQPDANADAAPSQAGGAENEENMLYWPTVIIRDIGAGAEGTDMMVVRRRKPDRNDEIVYVFMMEGDQNSYVWVEQMNGADNQVAPRTLSAKNMNEFYIRVNIHNQNGLPSYTIELRRFRKFLNNEFDEFDEEAKRIRKQILDRRAKNRDKFWNPGIEKY